MKERKAGSGEKDARHPQALSRPAEYGRWARGVRDDRHKRLHHLVTTLLS